MLLEGHVDDRDSTIRRLQDTNRMQAEEIRMLRDELAKMQNQTDGAAVSELRQTLTPLFHSLQKLFKAIDACDGGQGPTVQVGGASDNAKWEFWKRRYPGRIADTIDILMLQPMNTTQLAHALKCDKRTVTNNIVYTLNKAGLLA
jgi:hypothetical protein